MDEQTLKTLKKQNFWLRLTAFCMGGIFLVALCTALILVPRTITVLNDAASTLEETDAAVQELNKTATKLSKVDIEGLVTDTQTLINDSSEGISQAMDKLNEIDIESLNTAISGLETVVKPLAKLFGN